ncbi:hypothetical protein D1872_334700 [compost metagenome]
MIHQHARRDLGIARIGHLEVFNIRRKRLVQIDFAGIDQHHGSGRDVHFAHRADSEHALFVHGDL